MFFKKKLRCGLCKKKKQIAGAVQVIQIGNVDGSLGIVASLSLICEPCGKRLQKKIKQWKNERRIKRPVCNRIFYS